LLAAASAAALVACGGGGGDSPAPALTVSGVTTGAARYSQQLLLTVNGANLDQGLTVTSSGCTNITRSTTAPNISTATTAYFTCTVSAVGNQSFAINRTSDGTSAASAPYIVPVPQVTMTVNNGAGVNGSYVITLAPTQAPITVNNFLAYVNSGFYNGTVFHRYSPNFVIQGGGFNSGLNPANPVPALKPTNAAIVLEDNAGLSNTRWTVAMARTNVADSATSQFFINLADNLFLNRTSTARGYAVFGTVTSGTDFVTQMLAAPCSAYPALVGTNECLPFPNLVMTAVQSQ
jgi:cyclophilin family peptidyl-prolyl cis-trans isomerase